MKNFRFYFFSVIFLFPVLMFAQQTITGKVTETTAGTRLPGVGIIIKGTTTGTSTDFDGNYKIENVKTGDILVFSYIGFKSQEISVGNSNIIDVILEESAEALEEVIVIGYGTTTVKDATGSVAAVTEDDFNKGAIVSTDQLLTGKAAGVRITSSGGQPDAEPNIRIRGGSSLSGNNNPLIVIDGIPIDNTNPAGVGNPLSLINPNDVESFSILKDASATAIYGSRASNGVIIITTKKGISGGVKFNFSTSATFGKVGDKINVMDGSTFTKFINEYHPSYTNLLGIDDPSNDLVDDPTTSEIEGRILSNTDWQDAIYRNTISYDHNFSARGSLFNKVPIRFSAGYTNTEGLVKENDYERFTSSVKLTPVFFEDHLKVNFNFKGIVSKKDAIDDGGALGGAINMDPTKPIYNDSSLFGGYYQSLNADSSIDGQWNPLAILMQRTRPEKVKKVLANVELDYKLHFLPEMRAVVNVGVESSEADITESYSQNSLATYKLNNNTSSYIFNPGKNYGENQSIDNRTLDAYLTYAKDLDGDIKSFDVQGGYSYQNFKNDGTKEEYRYNTETGLREVQFDAQNPYNRYYNELNLQSFFGRANLNLLDKYLFTASIRADGSSLFNEDNRWGAFPAAAMAWKMDEEQFIQDLSFINTLKMRLGWGKTGQQDITGAVGFYPSTPLFETGSSTSQYLEGVPLYSAKPFNEDLTWEKTTTYNFGLDFDLFENSILTGNFDVFYRETSDLLAEVPIAPGQGLTDSFVQNVGETESKGFELNLNFNVLNTEDMNLDFYSNVSYARSEVTNLKDVNRITADDSGLPVGTGVNLAYHTVDHQPYSAWVYRQLYDKAGNPIHDAFADFNGDGSVDNDDRYYVALRPNWTFGFGLNFNYKKFDLSSSFRGQFGGQVYNSRRLTSGYVDNAIPNNSNSLSNVLDFYTDSADVNFIDNNGNVKFSDYYLEDATFLRCENIVVGYTIDTVSDKINFRVYGALNNPFIITNYSGQDPENYNSIDDNFYPRPKSFTLGLTMDF
ncbi:SusC/RagA family TonB-linked outer membrane protein [Lutibacter citreus]|uniref:SusC/RagA family TonB-linked outer membrane protein n=1 Tax=Lutibacter citreus TaxID=2138210 RepID=UPI000DBE79CE|nr:SusC/RagA family TonB-linked outer membrane protein [Lutibacter citreus]